MNKILSKIWSKISQKYLTDSRVSAVFSETREIEVPPTRDIKVSKIGESKTADFCPYCQSKDFVKRGTRKKKLEVVQLYLCRNCKRTFTAQFVKGKHYPTKLIIDAISIYNLGYGLEETCRLIKQRYGVNPGASTLNDWYV